jgi:HEAT repeat protein
MTWTWPHRIALLHGWPAIVLVALFVLGASRLIARRSKSRLVIFGFLGWWLLMLFAVSLGGLLAHLLHRDTETTAWNTVFYLLYGCAAVLAALSIPRLIAELRDAAQRVAIAWRRPNVRRLAARGRVEDLWRACLFCDWHIAQRSCFRTGWVGDWTLSLQAVEAVAGIGRLAGLFEMLEKSRRSVELARILAWLGERPVPNATEALVWLARRSEDYKRTTALRALSAQQDAELSRACDWNLLAAIACGRVENDAEFAADICCRVQDARSRDALAAATTSRWGSVRWRAISTLAEAGDRRAVAPLLELLKEPRWADLALGALCRVPDPRAAAPVAALLPTLSPSQAVAALGLLEQIGDSSAADAVAPLLKNPECAPAAVRVLSRFGWTPATEADAISLRIANEDWAGCVAVGALAVEPLLEALAAPHSDRVAIVGALGRLGDTRAVAPIGGLVSDNAPEDLIRAATMALGGLGDAGCAALVEMSANHPGAVGRAAFEVLSTRSPEAALDAARKMLAGDGPLSAEALEQVAVLGTAAIPLFCEACRGAGDSRVASVLAPVVRLGGAAALAETIQGKASTVPFLINKARSGCGETTAAAVAVLKCMPPSVLSGHLLNHLQQPARLPAETMIELLSGVAPQVAGALESLLLTSRDKEVLTVAVEVLARTGGPRAAPAILAAIKKDRLRVSDVRTALARLGGAAVEGLCGLLPAGGLDVIRLLGEIGDARAIEALTRALMADDESRVAAGADALDALGWRPSNDAASARYLAFKGRLEECRGLGAVGVRALAFAIGHFESRSWNDHTGNQPLRDQAIAALGRSGEATALDVLVPLLRTGSKPSRQAAARSLIELARTVTFSDEQRVRLLQARSYVTSHADSRGPHTDHARHFDKGTFVPSHDCHESSVSHDDNPNPVNYSRFADIRHKDVAGGHADEGLGMPFPL